MKLTARAALNILKPINEVYQAIVDPAQLTQYFIGKSSGRIETGAQLIWEYDDFPGPFPVQIVMAQENKYITFIWDQATIVKMELTAVSNNKTRITITEGEKELSEENLNWLIGNTCGWANFLDCMKAYLEHGIKLRNGAFDKDTCS